MKIIVTDISTSRVIIYNLPNDRLNLLSEEQDVSDIIEDLLSDNHRLKDINWMELKEDFNIEFCEL